MDSALIWFAGAAVLVGLGLVLLSLSMTMRKNQAAAAEGDAFTAGHPPAQGLFIDEPLMTDLASGFPT